MMFLGPASASAQIDAADLRRAARFLSEPTREAPINPSIVVIVVILTIIFFLSGCLHLLIRCLVRAPRRDPNSIVTLTALQGQLQQLFHLHDSGVEQAFIDTLPVFFYKSVKGLKEGADCAVCLCEFQGEDRLRLLPKCSHAFHLECIDTWLLSHSTCPLCRRSLLPDESPLSAPGHGLLLDSSRSSDGVAAEAPVHGRGASESGRTAQAPVEESSVHVRRGSDLGAAAVDVSLRVTKGADQDARGASVAFPQEHAQSQYAGQVLPVQLGRFRVVAGNASADASASMNGSRRSYSVGSYEYVLDPSNLEVVIAPTPHRRRTSTPRRPTPGHRTTLSECNPEDILPDPVVTPFVEDGLFFARPAGFEADAAGRVQVQEEGQLEGSGWVSVELGPAQSDNSALTTGPSTVAVAASETSAVSALTTSCSSSSRRAFSFRYPPSSEVAKLKASASRRSVSETELPTLADVEDDHAHDDDQAPHHPDHDHLPAEHLDTAISFSGAQLVSASTQLSNYDVPRAGGRGLHQHSGLARRTISWLVGKPYKWKPLSLSTYMNAGHR